MLVGRIDTTDPGSLRRWRAEQPVRLGLGNHNGRVRILRGIGELGGKWKSIANAVADFMGVTVHIDNVGCRADRLVTNLENSLHHFSLCEINDRGHADCNICCL